MQLEKIEHIGIAVKSLDISIPIYEKLLASPCYKVEEVASQKVRTAFFHVGPNKIELLEATSDESVIHSFISKKGEGIHHIAYAVEDISSYMQALQEEGFTLLNDAPLRGADEKWVCFVHPKDSSGVLTELCQDIESTP